jgi:subtilisin family serine protease
VRLATISTGIHVIPRTLRLFPPVAAALLGAVVTFAQGPASRRSVIVNGREAVDGEVLVKFSRQLAQQEYLQLGRDFDATENEAVGSGLRRLRSRRLDPASLVAALRNRPDVEYAEPNYIWRATVAPNDPQFANLWGLLNTGQNIGGAGVPNADIHAASAWAVATGSRANVVGVIDTGIDYTHPDLVANMWAAPTAFTVTIGGVPMTCPAGTHGFNAITRTCDPLDDNNHGTHVSGTIGASGNNARGVIGVNWNASIMGLKFLDNTGSGSTSDAVNAIEFAIQAKAAFAATGAANVRVLSNSWGGSGFSQSLLNEINKANTNGMLFVAAAGNNGTSNDTTPTYPGSYDAPNVISVAATDNTDHLASFSNFGSSVHLAAPGTFILSTTIGNTYSYFSGTSMATPHVSGAAGLVLSVCALNVSALRANLIGTVDAVSALSGLVSTGGRLNVDRAIRACAPSVSPTAPSAPTAATVH